MTILTAIQILASLALAFLFTVFIFMVRLPDRHLMRPTLPVLAGFLALGILVALAYALAVHLRPSP